MLRLFNTISRQLEEFKPINKEAVGLYTCGPTVYDFAHIGNLRTYIFEDVLKRALVFAGFNVKHVMNITDVGHLTNDSDFGEDKIEKTARLESKKAVDIAAFYTDAFKSDLRKLNISEPTIWCRATDHIAEQVALIKKLEEKGFTYSTADGVYFDTSKVKNYGKLARLNIAGQEAGARVEINTEKKHPTDFALWKFSPTDVKRQMEWESPWGVGFPGWHIECSAMSMKYLGETFDIHAGGVDHVPVHHTNEIAQSEAATGKPFARYWLHGEFLLINEGKMAKSEGNFITLKALEEKGFDPITYRFYCLSSHYRSKLNFTWDTLANAKVGWDKFKNKFFSLGRQNGKVDETLLARFKEKVDDDLNMPQAVAVAWDVFKSDLTDFDKRATLVKFDEVMGLGLAELHEAEEAAPVEVSQLAKERDEARAGKKWKKADELRQKIGELGWQVVDESDASHLKRKD